MGIRELAYCNEQAQFAGWRIISGPAEHLLDSFRVSFSTGVTSLSLCAFRLVIIYMQMEPRNARGGQTGETGWTLKRGKGVGEEGVEEGSFRAPFIAVTKLKISIQF